MPELPEVETIARGLHSVLYHKITDLELYRDKLREFIDQDNIFNSNNKIITAIRRRAKYIIFDLNDSSLLIFHLGMTGRIVIVPHDYINKKHDHLVITLSNGEKIVFNDQRRFGMVWHISCGEEKTFFAEFGPEPFTEKFSSEYLFKRLQGKKSPIKSVIMDNRIVVGVGNIYAAESLFRVGIDPLKPSNYLDQNQCEKLIESIRSVLQEAIDSGGSSLKDYVKSDGTQGYFQHKFLVYGREGQNCYSCESSIANVKIGGRSSFFCPSCQK